MNKPAPQERKQAGGEVPATFMQHRFKCLACSLHFTVHSWYEGWPMEGTTRQQADNGALKGEPLGCIFCPECGSPSPKLAYSPATVEGFIWDKGVPAGAEFTGLSAGLKPEGSG